MLPGIAGKLGVNDSRRGTRGQLAGGTVEGQLNEKFSLGIRDRPSDFPISAARARWRLAQTGTITFRVSVMMRRATRKARGSISYSWNAESEMKAAAGVTYGYDGDGRRVYKSSGKLYWYGAGGDILAETDASGNTLAEYVFFGGKRLAMLPAGGNPIYYVEDMLGTSRVITQNNGAVCYDADFDPF